jgi:plasmid stability protein
VAILQVQDVPDDLYENLTAIAKIENRSISQETIVLLKTALQQKTERVSHRKAILAEIDKLNKSINNKESKIETTNP